MVAQIQSRTPSSYTLCNQFPAAGHEAAAEAVIKQIRKKTTPAEFDQICQDTPDFDLSYGAVDSKLGHFNALHAAVWNGNCTLVNHICQIFKDRNPALLNVGTEKSHLTALCLAIYPEKAQLSNKTSLKIAQILLTAGADVNSAYINIKNLPHTALMAALTRNKCEALAIYLLRYNASVTEIFFKQNDPSPFDQLTGNSRYNYIDQIRNLHATNGILDDDKIKNSETPYENAIKSILPILDCKLNFERVSGLPQLTLVFHSPILNEAPEVQTWKFRPITEWKGEAMHSIANELKQGSQGVVSELLVHGKTYKIFSINKYFPKKEIKLFEKTIQMHEKEHKNYIPIVVLNLGNTEQESAITAEAENKFVNFFKKTAAEVYADEAKIHRIFKEHHLSYAFKLGSLTCSLLDKSFNHDQKTLLSGSSASKLKLLTQTIFFCFLQGLETIDHEGNVYHPDDYISALHAIEKTQTTGSVDFPGLKIRTVLDKTDKFNGYITKNFITTVSEDEQEDDINKLEFESYKTSISD